MDAHRDVAKYGPSAGIVAVLLALLAEVYVLMSQGVAAFDDLHPLPVRVAFVLAGLAFLANAAYVARDVDQARASGISPLRSADDEASTTSMILSGVVVGIVGLGMVVIAAVAL
jgi:hypothetical protein